MIPKGSAEFLVSAENGEDETVEKSGTGLMNISGKS
jgi:hypothetical protein